MEQELASLFSTLSDENRLRIIRFLWQSPRTVSEISIELDMSISAISHQLSKLKQYEIVECKKNGKQRIYTLKKMPVMCVLYFMLQNDNITCPHNVRFVECKKLKEIFS
ncbi:MAG: ArsR/SmtB family transcription factor [Candidatus Methanofastidiosia archaeon]